MQEVELISILRACIFQTGQYLVVTIYEQGAQVQFARVRAEAEPLAHPFYNYLVRNLYPYFSEGKNYFESEPWPSLKPSHVLD